jgi:cellulose synthase/poly-beta-1,6-N-acetylglucosamine synthase-like glycosyltransferase
MILDYIWVVFFASAAIQFNYLIFIFGRLAFTTHTPYPEIPSQEEGVTVLVAARNEKQNLERLIPLLSAQNHPQFEILIVNDRSTDGTEVVLSKMMDIHSRLRTVTVKYTPTHVTAKKYALTLGIKVAKYDIVLLTDADCIPATANWIQTMSRPIWAGNKMFALGHGAYVKSPGFLNRLIQYETLFTGLNYLSFALWKAPLMGVGRNLCYRKSFFMEKKGFKNLWHINGGDDDLLINQHATGSNTAVVIHPDALTLSDPQTNWKEYLTQKNRHFHAGKYYKTRNKLKIGIYMFTHLMFWVTVLLLLFTAKSWEPIAMVGGLTLVRQGLQFTVFTSAEKKLEGIGNVSWTLIFDVVYLSYFWIVGTKGYLSKKIRWK